MDISPNANYVGLDELVWGLDQVGGGEPPMAVFNTSRVTALTSF